MKNPYEILRQKEIELSRLEREVEALRIAIKLLADDADLAAAQKTKELSQADKIRAVLEEADHPLHVSEIASRIQKKYNTKLKNTYVTSTIYRYMRQKKFFRKEKKPATFGLLDWPHVHVNVLEVDGVRLEDKGNGRIETTRAA